MRVFGTVSLFLVALFAATQAQAAVVTGNIYEVRSGGADVGSTVDHWYFTVNSVGVITIDTLSWEIDGEDRHDGDLNFSEAVDVNGDGEIAFFDPYIYLFSDDGSLDVGDLISSNDDSGSTYSDGSIYAFDSYLSLALAPGDYVLAIGAYFLDATEAAAGTNDETFYPTTYDETLGYSEIDHGDYQITFSGDLTITAGPAAGVPEPASMTLWSLGAVGAAIAAARRRKTLRSLQ